MNRIDRATRRYQAKELTKLPKIEVNKKTRAENRSVIQMKLKNILK